MANLDLNNSEPAIEPAVLSGEKPARRTRRGAKKPDAINGSTETAAGAFSDGDGVNTPPVNENGAGEPPESENPDAVRDDLAGDPEAERQSMAEEEAMRAAMAAASDERLPIPEDNPFRSCTEKEILGAIRGLRNDDATDEELDEIHTRCRSALEAGAALRLAAGQQETLVKAAARSMGITVKTAWREFKEALDRLREYAREMEQAAGDDSPRWLRAMNRKYVMIGGKIMRINRTAAEVAARGNRLEGVNRHEFENIFANTEAIMWSSRLGRNIPVPWDEAWRKSTGRAAFDRVDMCEVGKEPHDVLNLWEGYAVQPSPKPWPQTETFLRDIICGGCDQDYDHLIKLLAKWMRNPLACGEVGIILLSSQGTGKGTLAEFIADLFGRVHSLFTASQESLLGKHNDHLLGRLFVFLDEAMFGGDHRSGDKLKQMINAPNIEIEPKFLSRFSITNRLHFLIASNSSKSVPLNTDDRRWHVLEVSDEKKNDRAYFGDLRKAWREGEREGFLHSLLDNAVINLTDFDPRPPLNDAKEQLMDSVASGPDRFVKQLILDCGADILTDAQQAQWEKGKISVASGDLYDAYRKWCMDTGHPDKYANAAVLGKTINYMLGMKRPTDPPRKFGVTRRLVRDGKKSVWHYELPKNSECVTRLEKAGITTKRS